MATSMSTLHITKALDCIEHAKYANDRGHIDMEVKDLQRAQIHATIAVALAIKEQTDAVSDRGGAKD